MLANGTLLGPFTEWAAASQVQQAFMQHALPAAGTLDYNAECRQLDMVGGDFYNFLPLGDGRLAFAIGDASGKGLAAALMIANVQSSLRTAIFFAGMDARAAINAVNRQVHAASLTDKYATLFYGVFDTATRILRYVNAGHNPPMVLHKDGSTTWLETGGAPVGMFSDWSYEEGTVRLDAGDVLVAYTDGITEALNARCEEWGVDGLRNAAVHSRTEPAQAVVRAIFTAMDRFSQEHQNDDATVMALRIS